MNWSSYATVEVIILRSIVSSREGKAAGIRLLIFSANSLPNLSSYSSSNGIEVAPEKFLVSLFGSNKGSF